MDILVIYLENIANALFMIYLIDMTSIYLDETRDKM